MIYTVQVIYSDRTGNVQRSSFMTTETAVPRIIAKFEASHPSCKVIEVKQ